MLEKQYKSTGPIQIIQVQSRNNVGESKGQRGSVGLPHMFRVPVTEWLLDPSIFTVTFRAFGRRFYTK